MTFKVREIDDDPHGVHAHFLAWMVLHKQSGQRGQRSASPSGRTYKVGDEILEELQASYDGEFGRLTRRCEVAEDIDDLRPVVSFLKEMVTPNDQGRTGIKTSTVVDKSLASRSDSRRSSPTSDRASIGSSADVHTTFCRIESAWTEHSSTESEMHLVRKRFSNLRYVGGSEWTHSARNAHPSAAIVARFHSARLW